MQLFPERKHKICDVQQLTLFSGKYTLMKQKKTIELV